MKITIENTEKTVELNGVPARIWEGTTESGIPVMAFVTRVGVSADQDCSAFERELQEKPPVRPSLEAACFDARLIL